MESDTPRTDAEAVVYSENQMSVPISFARELERDLAAMRQQRDEARREVCNEIARIRAAIEGVFDPKRVAIKRGWDCFAQKEGGGA